MTMLTIVSGPMFSGKTTWLIEHIQSLAPGSFIVFKPDIDTRFKKCAYVAHSGKSFPAVNLNTKKPDFTSVKKGIENIIIDELNFFAPGVMIKAITHQLKRGKNVIGAGVLYDYNRQPFGSTLPLSKMADTHIRLFATCDGCGKDAVHSYRKVKEKKQFLLGAGELYGACCDGCWEILNPFTHSAAR